MEREVYTAPVTDVLEIKAEGVICLSLANPDDYMNAGDPFAVVW